MNTIFSKKTDSKFSSKDHVKNVMLVGCRPNYNLKLNVRITTLLDLVPSSAMVYCTLKIYSINAV